MSKQDVDSSNKSISLADEAKIVPDIPVHTLDYEAAPSSNPYYFPQLSWSDKEESKIIRTLDTRLFPWILLTTFVLNMDRTNHSNAVSDNLAVDLGFTNDTVNLGIAVYSVIFSFACLSGAVISKIVGPARWIPVLMFAWGLVTMAHALITDRSGYLTVRCMIALTEGGVIPATLVYLGSFYKSTELATRLAWFWGIQTIASAVSGLMASGLLQLRGIGGLEGWKWLFLIDGIITVVVAVATWFYLPKNIAQTAGGLRGWKPWFDERQLQIGVTRVVQDDISKRVYEQKVKWSDVKDAATDLGLWGHLLITVIGMTPTTPLATYLPTVIKSFHFDVFVANALTAPPYVLQCIMMVSFIWHSDRFRERGLHGAFGAAWQLVGWILLRALPSGTSRGVKYFAAIVVAAWPYTHPLNIAWMSENTGSVGKRTIASGCVIFAANIYGVWGSQIYQSDDAPDYKRGNTINICFAGVALILWFVQKYYYRYRNARNATLYAELSEQEKAEENDRAEERGNRGLTYRFTT
ncbi:related to nicotinamide mononucleotide permease [Armillaria ostoyae]|uniref:Related to nicotinamide mononucleotide permease n=1 Tax=Armillaria ostoyae TaxID=47428 RepID=A0A284RQ76_ARMOS|nr:related to nicotinamide mononucleotide permease [Armillaria ostoyae]